MTERAAIQLILDAGALKAYGHNATVGELLGEIESKDELTAFSAGSLAQALGEGADQTLIELLLQRDSCRQLTPMAEWEEFGAFLRRIGPRHDVHDAYLVMLAFMHRAYILTADPQRYASIHRAVRCIPLEEPWGDA
ncbi:hypothetical protein Cme02nite_76030 [Catellatospora methionotrophica]|uniref:PIN domain-containing protein n=1 Tax=Catellatospora methionotrophica TaxID=121620 RepID=A0A8J3PL85_9ACTN|nr:hypothetical protein [Catellatospora methionotrophica]GIG19271.1 hypothetical protein Cme02nite_76030 [Catellatospora methionotrophica]